MSEKIENINTASGGSEWDILRENKAANLVDIRRDFLDGAEIFPGREADAICRMPKPLEIPGEKTYEEVMEIIPDDEPVETRFFVKEEDFPRFSEQAKATGTREHPHEFIMDINNTVDEFVGETATMIEQIGDVDMVAYLDKSARPVSWFVNEFWEDFSDKERRPEAFLAIDRLYWFREAGVDVDGQGNLKEDGYRKATYNDFEQNINKLDSSIFAKIRALFIPGGVDTEDAETIMNTPTGLEGKTLLVVDEVRRSGSTLDIATKTLLLKALPELKEIKQTYFWHPAPLISENFGEEDQMGHTPVWYDADKTKAFTGRGVWDINQGVFDKQYENNPNNYTRAQKLGGLVLGEPMNVDEEPGQVSLEYQREIRRMHEEYEAGHLMPTISVGGEVSEKIIDKLMDLGVEFAPLSGMKSKDAKKYVAIKSAYKDRQIR